MSIRHDKALWNWQGLFGIVPINFSAWDCTYGSLGILMIPTLEMAPSIAKSSLGWLFMSYGRIGIILSSPEGLNLIVTFTI